MADPIPNPTAANPVWSPWTRIGFRLAFCYLTLYAVCCGNTTFWKTIPLVGDRLELLFWWPFKHAAPWFGQHLFHLTGTSAWLHPVGVAGDQALTYVSIGIMLVVASVATLLWTALDRRSTAYPRLYLWLRLLLRVAIGAAMLIYGTMKLFPNQMAAPSLAVLNEPMGETSPMTLLWTMLGLHPLYEMICGATELLCGVLILFRRTALLGALLTVFVVGNVALYNYFFDVPVKIYATHLLLMAFVLIAPDLRALFGFFWQHTPATARIDWSPWKTSQGLRTESLLLAAFVAMTLANQSYRLGPQTLRELHNIAHPGPLTGLWHVDHATQPYITGDGLPMTVLSLEPNGRAMLRASDNALWRATGTCNPADHTLRITPIGRGLVTLYTYTQPDATHLVLTPLQGQRGVLTLSRIPTPAKYPLLERGFHWVNEWGLER